MKKVVCVLIALLLCFSLLTPAFAASEGFVPSISYKDGPGLSVTEDIGGWLVEGDKDLEAVLAKDLIITPISAVESASDISAEAAKTLQDVYKALADGSAELPMDKYIEGAPENPVIRNLFDVTLTNEAQGKKLDKNSIDIRLTFDLGVADGDNVLVMVYENGQWDPAVSVKNDGNGKVTCVLPHLCPVAVVIGGDSPAVPVEPSRTADESGNLMWLWILLIVLCAFIIIVIIAKNRKKKETN